MTPDERHTARSLGGRIGAHQRWATVDDRTAATQAGREAFMTKFEREVDPEGVLTGPERARRAESARKAHFARLALQSAKARAARKSRGSAAA